MAEFALDYEHLSDVDLAKLVVRRDPNAVRLVTRRNNQRPATSKRAPTEGAALKD